MPVYLIILIAKHGGLFHRFKTLCKVFATKSELSSLIITYTERYISKKKYIVLEFSSLDMNKGKSGAQ